MEKKNINTTVEDKKEVENFKILELKVEEKQTHDGKKFFAYKALKKDGRYMDLRFRKTVKNAPEENCKIKVLTENMSLDLNRKYPRVWIHAIEEIIVEEIHNDNNDLPF